MDIFAEIRGNEDNLAAICIFRKSIKTVSLELI